MRAIFMSLAFLAVSAVSAVAQTSALQSLEAGNDARGWEAVGQLDINGNGFCTGALIAPDIVLTAAHCMFEKAGGAGVETNCIEFLAGLRSGRPEAARNIRRAIVHPSYVHTGEATAEWVRYDVALLQLDRPIRSTNVAPFKMSTSMHSGTRIGVVSYAQDRAEAPSLQETCNVLGEQTGVLIMDCNVDFGSYGAPIFRNENGVIRLVSVVSATADVDGERVALGKDLAAPIATLRAALEDGRGLFRASAPSARFIRQGERAHTGALFVRP